MATYILVPGGCHGGWAYDAVARRLTEAGHRVDALTLSGLDGGPAAGVNLERHLADVVAAIEAVDTPDAPVILAGHSYGGMVIAGAADRLSSRVAALVFVDAFVPDDRDSVRAPPGARGAGRHSSRFRAVTPRRPRCGHMTMT